MTREKQLRTFIHRHRMDKSGKSTMGYLLDHYYNEDIDPEMRYSPSKYCKSMRYVWALIPEQNSTLMHRHWVDWADLMRGLGHFRDGPGWYSYVQTGPKGIYSNLIFGSILCSGRNEAHKVASSRSSRGYVVPKKDVDAMMARINLLGQAISEG